MSAPFDPYYVWLGIPPHEQPPNHYRLLGLERFEANPDVIANAAEQRMVFLRSTQVGPNAAASQRLLSEITAAQRVLLDAERKREYDAQLRRDFPLTPAPTSPGPIPTRPPPRSTPTPPPVGVIKNRSSASHGRRVASLVIVAGTILLLGSGMVVAAAAYFLIVQPKHVAARHEQKSPPRPTSNIAPPKDASDQAEPPSIPVDSTSRPPEGREPVPEVDDPLPPPDTQLPADTDAQHPALPAEPESQPVEPPPTSDAGDPGPISETPDETPTIEKPAAPSLDEQRPLLARVEQLYALADLKTRERRLQAARELQTLGQDRDTSAEERFVLLRRAAELAAEAGDFAVCSEVVHELEDQFAVDALTIEAALLARIVRGTLVPANLNRFAEHIQDFVDVAITEDRFEPAHLVLSAIEFEPTPSTAKAAQIIEQAKAKTQARQEQFLAVQEATRAIALNPDDVQAQLVLARWHCFEKGDWERGMAHLAAGSDPSLRRAASAELKESERSASDVLSMANTWWDVAMGLEEPDKRQVLRRAAFWYRQVDSNAVTGLDQVQLKQRLGLLQELLATTSQSADASSAGQEERFATLFEKALHAVRERRFGEADRYFGHCVRIRPDDVAALNNQALACVRLGQTQRAVKLWERIMAEGIDAEAAHNLARFQNVAQRGDVPLDRQSRGALDTLVARAKGNTTTTGSVKGGWLYLGLDGHSQAIDDRTCMFCSGSGNVDCPVRGCSHGKVRVPKSSVAGVNPITGQRTIQTTTVSATCDHCNGRGTIDCQNCLNGLDPSLR